MNQTPRRGGKMKRRLGMLACMKGSFQLFAIACAAVLLSACGARRSVVVQPTHPSSYANAPKRAPAVENRSGSGTYRVVKGDTLYSIAFRHGTDFRELARWNGIAAPYTIWPGQELVLSPRKAPAQPVARSPTVAHVPPPPVHQAASPVPVPSLPAAAPLPRPTASVAEVPVAGEPAPVPPPPPPVSPTSVPKGATRSIGGIAWRWPAEGPLLKGFQSGDAIPGIEIGGRSGSPVRAAADGVVVYSGNGLVGYGELIIVKHNDSFLSAYGHNRKRLVKEGQRVSAGQEIAEMGSTGASRDELQFQIRRNGNPVNPLDYLPAH